MSVSLVVKGKNCASLRNLTFGQVGGSRRDDGDMKFIEFADMFDRDASIFPSILGALQHNIEMS
jgi:hypothetical protein